MREKKQDIIKISSIQDIIKISNLLIDSEKTNHKDRWQEMLIKLEMIFKSTTIMYKKHNKTSSLQLTNHQ